MIGDRLRDRGMKRAAQGAGAAWIAAAATTIVAVARTRARFTADDVWRAGLRKPRDPRALGPAFRRAWRDGIIEPTSVFVKATLASKHSAPTRVWSSLLYRGP